MQKLPYLLAAGLAAFPLAAGAQERAQPLPALQAAYRAHYEHWGRGEVGAAMEIFGADYTLVLVNGQERTRAQQVQRLQADSSVRRMVGAPALALDSASCGDGTCTLVLRARALTTLAELSGGTSRQLVDEAFRDRWRLSAQGWRLERRQQLRRRIVGEVLDDQPRSPLLAAALARAAASPSAIDDLIASRGAPLVEPIVGDSTHRLVTFVWRGDAATERVELAGGLPAGPQRRLERLGGTRFWYTSLRLPADTRTTYAFDLWSAADLGGGAGKLSYTYSVADPLNPAAVDDGSLLQLPDAPAQPYLSSVAEGARGTVVRDSMRSERLGEQRTFSVYTPPERFRTAAPYPLLVLFDGEMYGSAVPTPAILDNLIAEGRIPPVAAVFVNARDRIAELSGSRPFTAFVVDELLPAVRARYGATDDPARTVVGGLSLGGVGAAYAAMWNPRVFGNVLSQSGAFWIPAEWPAARRPVVNERGRIIGDVLAAERLPIRFWMEAGRYETYLLDANRLLHAVLTAKGYPVTYTEFTGNHNAVNWRGSLSDGLVALLGPPGSVDRGKDGN